MEKIKWKLNGKNEKVKNREEGRKFSGMITFTKVLSEPFYLFYE